MATLRFVGLLLRDRGTATTMFAVPRGSVPQTFETELRAVRV